MALILAYNPSPRGIEIIIQSLAYNFLGGLAVYQSFSFPRIITMQKEILRRNLLFRALLRQRKRFLFLRNLLVVCVVLRVPVPLARTQNCSILCILAV